MSKRRGLGKGLSELGLSELLTHLGGGTSDVAAATTSLASPVVVDASPAFDGISAGMGDVLRRLPIECMRPGRFQPRRHWDQDSLQELATSIRAQGLLQPIVVRPIEGNVNEYEIVAGERRWRAAQLAGLAQIPVLVKVLDDQATMAAALIENIQRESLNALETANAFQRLLDECGLTHQAVAEAVGKSRVTVTNFLRLLKLHPKVQRFVEEGVLDMGHARALLGLEGVAQCSLAETIVKQGLSVRETEQRVQRWLADDLRSEAAPAQDPDLLRLEQNLSDYLSTKVQLKHAPSGRGKVIIHYDSLDAFDTLLSKLKAST